MEKKQETINKVPIILLGLAILTYIISIKLFFSLIIGTAIGYILVRPIWKSWVTDMIQYQEDCPMPVDDEVKE